MKLQDVSMGNVEKEMKPQHREMMMLTVEHPHPYFLDIITPFSFLPFSLFDYGLHHLEPDYKQLKRKLKRVLLGHAFIGTCIQTDS